jgi:hypothetical protein
MQEAIRERKQARDKVAEYFDEKRSRHPEHRMELQDLLGYRWRTGLAVIELAVRQRGCTCPALFSWTVHRDGSKTTYHATY